MGVRISDIEMVLTVDEKIIVAGARWTKRYEADGNGA